MDVSNVELYEALKPAVGEEAARMLAEVVPPSQELVTKAYLSEEIRGLERRLEEHARQMNERLTELSERLTALSERFTRFILLFFVPLWITAAAAIVTSIVGG